MKKELSFVMGLLLILACKKQEATIPSYIYIDQIQLTTDYNFEGSNSAKISDAWVYYNDNLIGAFELPCTVPIIATATGKLAVRAGIKRNGNGGDRIPYPFYDAYETNISAAGPEDSIFVQPVLTYKGNANIWDEKFDSPSVGFLKTGASKGGMSTTTNSNVVFEGLASGSFVFVDTIDYIRVETDQDFVFGTLGDNGAYMELDYNTDVNLHVYATGLRPDGVWEKRELIVLYPTSDDAEANPIWNKTYLEMSYLIGLTANGQQYEVGFEVFESEAALGQNAHCFVDNVKVVH